MEFCEEGANCRNTTCQKIHPWNVQFPMGMQLQPSNFNQQYMQGMWTFPAGFTAFNNQQGGYYPGKPPPEVKPPTHHPQQVEVTVEQHVEAMPQQVPKERKQMVGGSKKWEGKPDKCKKRKCDKYQKFNEEPPSQQQKAPVKPREYTSEQLAKQLQQLNIDKQQFGSGIAYLNSNGFCDNSINIPLLKLLQGNAERALQLMLEAIVDEKQDQLRCMMEEDVFFKFVLLKGLGYQQWFGRRKILCVLEKCNNDLQDAIQLLQKKSQIKQNKHKFKKKVDNLEYQPYQFKFCQDIPEGSEFLIDCFNILYTNKHLRKLFQSETIMLRAEAIIRLRILVETLAEGHLVLDEKFLPDEIEKEIQDQIGVVINKPKLVKEVCAAQGSSADDKIVEILSGMTPERQKKILLVTSDNELIQRCLRVSGGRIRVINGKQFIKTAKKMHEKGIRKKILIKKQ